MFVAFLLVLEKEQDGYIKILELHHSPLDGCDHDLMYHLLSERIKPLLENRSDQFFPKIAPIFL